MIPQTKDLGPCHRVEEGHPCHAPRKDLRPHSRREESTASLRRETPQKGIHRTIEEPIRRPLLLHQKERRQAETSPRLSTAKRTHHTKPIPPTTHPRTHQPSTKRSTILKV